MSETIIQVDYQRLDQVSRLFQQESERVEKLLNCVVDQCDALRQNRWKSQSASSFYSRMDQDVLPGISRLAHALQKASTMTLIISKLMWEADENAAALLQVGEAGHDLMDEMRRNIKSDIANEIRDNLRYDVSPGMLIPGYGNVLSAIESAEMVEGVADWANQVRSGQPWDHKSEVKARYGEEIELVDGLKVNYDVYSNIHYGFVGRSVGFHPETLKSAAGFAQMIDGNSDWKWFQTRFDDPRDQAAISIGIELYDTYGENFTEVQFVEIYKKHHYALR